MSTQEMSELVVPGRRWWPRSSDSVQRFLYLLRRNKAAMFGLAITLFFVFLAIFAPVIATHDPITAVPRDQYQPPSREHLFGTNKVGWDIFSRVVYSTRIDFLIALASVVLAIALGVPLGAVTGFLSGRFDDVLMRVLDALQAMPSFVLAMAVVAALGKGIWLVIGVIAFVNFPAYLRLVRAEVKSKRESLYSEAAQSVGNPRWRIIFRHLLPNCLDPVLAQAPMNAGWAILTAAGLSFIGLGVPVPTPEWGLMINDGAESIVTGEWWISFFPGVAALLAVLGLNLLGEGLRDILDPRRAGL